MMFFVKLTQLINPERALDTYNIEWDMYLIHGGLKAAEFFGCEIDEVEERRIEIDIQPLISRNGSEDSSSHWII